MRASRRTPDEARYCADCPNCGSAGRQIGELSSAHVKLIWGITDNLGDWAVIRRRINEVIDRLVKDHGYTTESANDLLRYVGTLLSR